MGIHIRGGFFPAEFSAKARDLKNNRGVGYDSVSGGNCRRRTGLGNAYAAQLIPEPSTYALFFGLGALGFGGGVAAESSSEQSTCWMEPFRHDTGSGSPRPNYFNFVMGHLPPRKTKKKKCWCWCVEVVHFPSRPQSLLGYPLRKRSQEIHQIRFQQSAKISFRLNLQSR